MKRFLLALTIAAASLGLARAESNLLARIDLGGPAWQAFQEGRGEAIPATVPGCIHTDLLTAGKIPDPYHRDNEKRVQWVGEANWVYRHEFKVAPETLAREHLLLRCEGLDTLATVRINGAEVGTTDNMFRTYEFDVKKLLRPGANTIEVAFRSVLPVIRAKEAKRKLPTWAYPGAAYVRKEPCNFGWDWGPTLVTCGIWRPISLVAFDKTRITDVAITQDHRPDGSVSLHVAVEAVPPETATAKAIVTFGQNDIGTATVALKAGRGTADVLVVKPELWWPAGMGRQPLYTVAVELADAAGHTLDRSRKRVGLRTLRTVEQNGDTPMHFVVNGVPFFAKGANWIPADCFANRLTPEILRRYMTDAVAANMNTLRFWGGGYYEEDALYDLCDDLGICIWLDFKFGCTTYPAFDPAFLKNVQQEAADNLRRLRHHASIALWCGNNEIMFFRGKDQWTKDKMSQGDYYRLFRDVLGGEVRRWAPQADYVTGSPDCGDVHFWEVWHGGKPFEVYRAIHGFVSEFGFQSFPEPKTVRVFTTEEDRRSVYSPVMMYHERSNRMYMDVKEDGRIGTDKIMLLVKKYFREPKDFETTLWLSQITQAYGIKYGAEGWRREMPRSMGCVYWQYNDCWPGSSWSSVDYFGRWKALQYAARRFYAPVLVSGVEDLKHERVDVHVTSDQMQPAAGTVSWTVTDVAGKSLLHDSRKVDIPARKSRKVAAVDLHDLLRTRRPSDLLVWLHLATDGAADSDNLVTLVYPRELNLVEPTVTADVAELLGTFVVTLRAEHPALWTWLELDGADARLSDNFIHVAPDRPAVIHVTPAAPMTLDAFRKALRVRSLYDTYAH